ncbi:conserved hypothetical protein [Frankia sp. Hr75.2]|nr:conserved hypothetical protein [Frankia sp. Hr75.2]
MEGQAAGPGAPRLRLHRLPDHDHPLGRGRHRAHPGEPVRAGPARRPRGRRHAGAPGPARGRVPARVHRGAVGIAVVLVVVYLALIVFPKLALGLSGFETGVAVMPLIRGGPDSPDSPDSPDYTDYTADTDANPAGRIRGARRLLTTAALIMAVLLLTSSLATTVLIPERLAEPGGPANGRALACASTRRPPGGSPRRPVPGRCTWSPTSSTPATPPSTPTTRTRRSSRGGSTSADGSGTGTGSCS